MSYKAIPPWIWCLQRKRMPTSSHGDCSLLCSSWCGHLHRGDLGHQRQEEYWPVNDSSCPWAFHNMNTVRLGQSSHFALIEGEAGYPAEPR